MATVTSRLATFLRKTEQMSKKNNKKKKKVIYIDDGTTIADMSNIGGDRRPLNINERGCRAQWETYIKACRNMVIPMLVTMGGICVVFLIIYLLLLLAG